MSRFDRACAVGLVLSAALVTAVVAQPPAIGPAYGPQTQPRTSQFATTPGATMPSAPAPADSAPDARGEAGSDPVASAAPQMIGDLIGGGAGGFRLNSTSTGPRRQLYNRSILAARSGIKIADNESPRPQDRAFATFNYFNTVNTFGAENYGLYRGLIGFEKTFLDGQASLGARMPFVQGDGPTAPGTDGFGDLTMILKYAFFDDRATGDILSGGLAVSVPTGTDFRLADGNVISGVVIQPWGGFIFSLGDVFTQGFTSLLVPTQSNDITLYTVDLGVGYRLWQASDNGLLQAIVPALETHLNIPFSETGPGSLIYFPDLLMSVTAGLHFGLSGGTWFTLAAGVPITGPQLYDAEFMTQFNMRF